MTTYWQILVRGQALRPTQGPAYEFYTYKAALDMVATLYGLDSLKKDVEIKEINPYLKIK